MSSENVSVADVHAVIGQSFEIHLYSQASTGYSWYLSAMPKGLVLVSVSATTVPPVMPGSKTRQSFTFVATAKPEGLLCFELLRIWQPTEPADTRSYAVLVSADEAAGIEARMTAEAGSARFLRPETFKVRMPPIMPYGVPLPDMKAADCCKLPPHIIPLYGYPPPNLSGQLLESVVESTHNCRVKYGMPWGLTDSENCVLKYGFPADCAAGAGPIIVYGFPPSESGTGTAIVAADYEANCVVKYGAPAGVGKDDNNCTLKYGMPSPKPECKSKKD